MSFAYFIVPYQPGMWENLDNNVADSVGIMKIDPLNYRENLLERWPEAKISDVKLGGYALDFSLPNPDGRLLGGLQGNLQAVSINSGYNQIFVEFVVWHRAYVPAHYRLVFFHGGDWLKAIELTVSTTRQAIAAFAGFQDL